nr:Chain A, moricin
GKIPVKAIKKAGAAIGKGLRAINIASTAHDVYSFFKPKHKKK